MAIEWEGEHHPALVWLLLLLLHAHDCNTLPQMLIFGASIIDDDDDDDGLLDQLQLLVSMITTEELD